MKLFRSVFVSGSLFLGCARCPCSLWLLCCTFRLSLRARPRLVESSVASMTPRTRQSLARR